VEQGATPGSTWATERKSLGLHADNQKQTQSIVTGFEQKPFMIRWVLKRRGLSFVTLYPKLDFVPFHRPINWETLSVIRSGFFASKNGFPVP